MDFSSPADPLAADKTWFRNHPDRSTRVRPVTFQEASVVSFSTDAAHVAIVHRKPCGGLLVVTGLTRTMPADTEEAALDLLRQAHELRAQQTGRV